MSDTGRIRRTVHPKARRILFGETVDGSIAHELPAISEVDRAHLVALAEAELVPPRAAARLLAAVHRMRRQRFAPIAGQPPRSTK